MLTVSARKTPCPGVPACQRLQPERGRALKVGPPPAGRHRPGPGDRVVHVGLVDHAETEAVPRTLMLRLDGRRVEEPPGPGCKRHLVARSGATPAGRRVWTSRVTAFRRGSTPEREPRTLGTTTARRNCFPCSKSDSQPCCAMWSALVSFTFRAMFPLSPFWI